MKRNSTFCLLLTGTVLILAACSTSDRAWSGAAPDKIKFPYSPISWNSLPWWMAKDAGRYPNVTVEGNTVS